MLLDTVELLLKYKMYIHYVPKSAKMDAMSTVYVLFLV